MWPGIFHSSSRKDCGPKEEYPVTAIPFSWANAMLLTLSENVAQNKWQWDCEAKGTFMEERGVLQRWLSEIRVMFDLQH